MKYAAIQAHHAQFSVALMCRVLGVSAAPASTHLGSELSVLEPSVEKSCVLRFVSFIKRAVALMAARACMSSCTGKASGADAKGSRA